MSRTSRPLEGKRVIVTGAGGFIGSRLCERLIESGALVRAYVHYNARGSWGWLDESPAASEMEVILGDVRDVESIDQAISGTEIVFHLAALIGIPYSYRAPRSYVHTNVEGTLNVLQAARNHAVQRVIHTSTSEVYGTAQYVPIDEVHPLQGQSPYAASKIGADKLAESFHLSFDLPVVTVRPFNTYGPRQSMRAILPTIVAQCLSADTLKLGNLTPVRDLNYVDDTADGFVAAALADDEALGCTINLGTGRGVSIGDLAKTVMAKVGRQIDLVQDEQRMRPSGSEVERLIADNALAEQLLKWHPRVPLEDGVDRTIDWVKKHLKEYRTNRYTV
jgi:NAD dependent epimerase/dehydratase